MKQQNNKQAVILAGEWNSANLGDEVICNTFKNLFQHYIPDKDIQIVQLPLSIHKMNVGEKIICYILRLIFKNAAERYAQTIRYKNIIFEMRKLISKYYIQKLIFVGGAVFQKYFVYSMRVIIIECTRHIIPVFFNACGYGPNSIQSLSIFKWILKQPCVKQVTTRDDLSLISSEGIKVVPDIAITAYRYYNFIIHKKQQIIGINIIAPDHYLKNSNDTITVSSFNNIIISMIEKISSIYKVVLFSNGACEDQEYIDWLYGKMGYLTNITMEERPKNGFELINIICGFSLVIGFRLHSLIVSYSYNIPTIGIAWDNKLAFWGQMTGNTNIYMLSQLPVECIPELIEESIRAGINKDRKTELENQIIEQIKTYII
jgi:polysaccharide pyruvyl transferase WcaK-like protein